jgi:hypothetical protein
VTSAVTTPLTAATITEIPVATARHIYSTPQAAIASLHSDDNATTGRPTDHRHPPQLKAACEYSSAFAGNDPNTGRTQALQHRNLTCDHCAATEFMRWVCDQGAALRAARLRRSTVAVRPVRSKAVEPSARRGATTGAPFPTAPGFPRGFPPRPLSLPPSGPARGPATRGMANAGRAHELPGEEQRAARAETTVQARTSRARNYTPGGATRAFSWSGYDENGEWP